MEKEIVAFLQSRKPLLCILSTSGVENQPQSAVMGYVAFEDMTLVLSTSKKSRKYKNLKSNNLVALTFGWSFSELNIQYQGVAEVIENGDEYTVTSEKFYALHEEAKRFRSPETVFVRVKPTWIRLTDFTSKPARVEEINY